MVLSQESAKNKNNFFFLSLAALGIVYGDIGTSPLYTVNQIFFGRANIHTTRMEILGAISLVVWAISIVVAFKYIVFVLRADNDGEGGVFALYGLLNQFKAKGKKYLGLLLIIAAGLLFGDGIITPAISVISSVEGLKVATPGFVPFVIPITIIILTLLFKAQKKGTNKVGAVFGPIIVVWFITIGVLGLYHVLQTPGILQAISPYYAFAYLTSNHFYTILLTLGAVMLAVTGGEAMYADMGHFGREPIRYSWFLVVYPALVLNYLGQGAFLLSGQKVLSGNIFYSMVPAWGLYPMVILATLATIIASQALISGGFSLASQAITLGLFPYIKVVHTHNKHEGQIYIPFINKCLYVGCILLVLFFQTSERLASAYGLAVSGVMVITSLAMFYICRYYWKWSTFKTLLIFLPLTIVDLTFLISNSLKLIEGGYIPLLIGLALLIIMSTWQWGRGKIKNEFDSYSSITLADLIELKRNSKIAIPRSIVFMTPTHVLHLHDSIPTLKQMFIERYGLLPQHLIFLTVIIHRVPRIHQDRYIIKKLYEDKEKGSIISVILNFGFMEDPNVEFWLEKLAAHHEVDIDMDYKKWNIHIMYERIRHTDDLSPLRRLQFALFKFLSRNSFSIDHYFGLGRKQPLSIEVIPVKIK